MSRNRFKYFYILVFVLMFLFSIKGFASEIALESGEITVTSTSTFTVKIPRKISLAKNEDGYLEGIYNLEVMNYSESDNSCLLVEPDAKFDMTSYLKKGIEVDVTQEETIFSNLLQTDLTKGHTTTGYIISNEPLSSGNWQGSFSFTISIQKAEIQTQGLLKDVEVATPSNAEKIDEIIVEAPVFEDELTEDVILEEPVSIATPSNASMAIEKEIESEVVETNAIEIAEQNINEDDEINNGAL